MSELYKQAAPAERDGDRSRREAWCVAEGGHYMDHETNLRDGLACAYCGDAAESGASLALDHVVPHSRGGTNKETNLVTCCERCNNSLGNRDMVEFAERVAGYLNHGLTGRMITDHIADCLSRPLKAHKAEALEMIARRGSAAKVLASL